MSGPPPTRRTLMMVEACNNGGSLKVVAAMFGVTMQRVHQVVRRHSPEPMHPPHLHLPKKEP